MTSEGIDEPLRALEDACRARNVPLSSIWTPVQEEMDEQQHQLESAPHLNRPISQLRDCVIEALR